MSRIEANLTTDTPCGSNVFTAMRVVASRLGKPYCLEGVRLVSKRAKKLVFSCWLNPPAAFDESAATYPPPTSGTELDGRCQPIANAPAAGLFRPAFHRPLHCACKLFTGMGDRQILRARTERHPLFTHLNDRAVNDRLYNPSLSLVDFGLVQNPLSSAPTLEPFMLTPWAEGVTLTRFLHHCSIAAPAIDARHAVDLLISLARCLADLQYAYPGCYVIHQDVKPSNIIVTRAFAPRKTKTDTTDPEKEATLAHLLHLTAAPPGARSHLACYLIDADASFPCTAPERSFCGTYGYTAPESLIDPAAVPNPHMDVFSFGVIAHELMVGAWPYAVPTRLLRTSTAWRDLYATVDELPIDVRIPAPFAPLIRSCLSIDPGARPFIDEVIVELERLRKVVTRTPCTLSLFDAPAGETARFQRPRTGTTTVR